MHTAEIAPSCTQNTGAPISRSRTLPPPTPVTSAKKAAVTNVWRSRTAINAPDKANTPIPARSSRRTISALSTSSIGAYFAPGRTPPMTDRTIADTAPRITGSACGAKKGEWLVGIG